MERLVLGVIAVIGLHTAFVLYMANVRLVDQDAAKVRSGPAGMAPGQIVVKPAIDTKLKASVTPPTTEDQPAALITGHTDRVRSRTRRVKPKDQRRPRPTDFARPIPAYASRTAPGPKSRRESFGDRVIVYRSPAGRPGRTFTVVSRSTDNDNYTPKPKKNSFIAKLQFVYKKPWDLIKAVGSRLR